jgi:NADH dehydrogenase
VGEKASVNGDKQSLKFEVVIAGGGFAGVYCAKSLAKELGPISQTRVALIADQNYMLFQPMLAEVCGSSLSPRHVVNPIRRICKDVTVLCGSIKSIDLSTRQLSLDAGHFTKNADVKFGHLVLALGGVVDLSRVPGMPEHAFLMKNVGDAQRLRATIIDRFEEANFQPDPEALQRLLTFVVVGGGYSGVETAGQILDLIQGVNYLYPRVARSGFKVILIHSGKQLLPEISDTLGEYCEKNMRERGVEIILNARVSAMTATKVFLQDGRVIQSHTVVTTVGNAPHPLIVDLCKKHNFESLKGRIVTDENLRAKNQDRIWVAGDCAAIPLYQGKEGEYCPPTAQFAYREGILLGKNIARWLRKQRLKTFKFKGLGELASIGHRSAVAEIFGMKFSGFIAWFMWRTIYLMKLPGLERKLRVMIDWTLDLFFPRDITLLQPRPTEVLGEMHLEKGDQLFHAGEPALSFYIVKSGRIDLLDENGLVKSVGAGEHFGERALLHDHIWRFAAVAAEPSTLVALDAKVFQSISTASSSIHHFFEASAGQYATRQQVEAMVATIPAEVRGMRTAELMSENLITVTTAETVAETLKKFSDHTFHSLPLLDENGKLLGVISEGELLDAIKNGSVTQNTLLKQVQPVQLPTVRPETPVTEAVDRFCRSGKNKLLVVDGDGKLHGVLTPIDLLSRRQKA